MRPLPAFRSERAEQRQLPARCVVELDLIGRLVVEDETAIHAANLLTTRARLEHPVVVHRLGGHRLSDIPQLDNFHTAKRKRWTTTAPTSSGFCRTRE